MWPSGRTNTSPAQTCDHAPLVATPERDVKTRDFLVLTCRTSTPGQWGFWSLILEIVEAAPPYLEDFLSVIHKKCPKQHLKKYKVPIRPLAANVTSSENPDAL
jgi:hypothetical protein